MTIPLIRPMTAPDGAHQQDHQRDRHGRHIREYLIGIIHRLQHGGGNYRRQTHLTAGGEVGPPA